MRKKQFNKKDTILTFVSQRGIIVIRCGYIL